MVLTHKRILFVDDEPAIRATLAVILRRYGFVVTVASTVAEALAEIKKQEFDLLLSDIALGAGMRGTELARIAQERRPELCVLLVSGFSSELLDADRVAPADWALLPKPYARGDLVRAIGTALRRNGEAGEGRSGPSSGQWRKRSSVHSLVRWLRTSPGTSRLIHAGSGAQRR